MFYFYVNLNYVSLVKLKTITIEKSSCRINLLTTALLKKQSIKKTKGFTTIKTDKYVQSELFTFSTPGKSVS